MHQPRPPHSTTPIFRPSTTEEGQSDVVPDQFRNAADLAAELQQIRSQIVNGLDRLLSTAMVCFEQSATEKRPPLPTTPTAAATPTPAPTPAPAPAPSLAVAADETDAWPSASTPVSPPTFPATSPAAPAPQEFHAQVTPQFAAGSPFSPVATPENQSQTGEAVGFPSLREFLNTQSTETQEAEEENPPFVSEAPAPPDRLMFGEPHPTPDDFPAAESAPATALPQPQAKPASILPQPRSTGAPPARLDEGPAPDPAAGFQAAPLPQHQQHQQQFSPRLHQQQPAASPPQLPQTSD